MAKIQGLDREFVVTINGKDIILSDPDPLRSETEVMQFYSNVYPQLTTSTVHGPEYNGAVARYTFKTTVGTKG